MDFLYLIIMTVIVIFFQLHLIMSYAVVESN